MFNSYDIETIAPGYGKIFQGKDLVEKQFNFLDEILLELDKSNSIAQYVPRNHVR